MLRFTADRRTLAFITAYYALVVYQWMAPSPFVGVRIALVMLTCAISWIAAVITHNTLHSPVFKNRTLNRMFQVVLTCAYGFPVSEYVPGHNLSHHRYMQQRRDVMRTTKVNTSSNLLNFILFVPRVAFDVTGANMRYMKIMRDQRPQWFHQFIIEATFCWGSKLVLLAIDWRKTLPIIVLPHLFAVWGITAVNYLQHDGADDEHPYNHSRNFVGRVFNWFTFNNGFHGMHHLEPGLHWSLLAKAHEEQVHPHIDPRLEQKSLLVYVFHAFFWPGQRVRFDGKAMVIPEEGPDLDWIPATGGSNPELGAVAGEL